MGSFPWVFLLAAAPSLLEVAALLFPLTRFLKGYIISIYDVVSIGLESDRVSGIKSNKETSIYSIKFTFSIYSNGGNQDAWRTWKYLTLHTALVQFFYCGFYPL